MFLACGVGAFVAGIFHVMTHAFFKACLFLGSGSVIHALSGEQDIRKMGGLKNKIPITYATFLVATLAISGVPLFAGFFSKDAILGAVFEAEFEGFPWLPRLLWVAALLTAGLTAFYMFRLLSLTFFGAYRGTPEQAAHIHESPRTMTIPLIVLAALSVLGGYVGFEMVEWGNQIKPFLSPIVLPLTTHVAHEHHVLARELALMGASVAAAGLGIFLALSWYLKGEGRVPERLAQRFPGVYRTLSNKYYVDEVYDAVFVEGLGQGRRPAALGGGRHGRGPDPQRRRRRHARALLGLPRLRPVRRGRPRQRRRQHPAGRLPALPAGGDGARPELRPLHGRGALRDRDRLSLFPMRKAAC